MSSPDILSLRWNNHETTFLKLLSAIHIKSQYEDATVACSGKLFPVHRLVLSCCSHYFEQMFAQTQGKHSIIVLKDISAEVFESLLSYMYTGEAEVKKELLSDLLVAAHALEIKGLAISDEEDILIKPNATTSISKENSILPKKRPIEEYQQCQQGYSAKMQKLEDSISSHSDSHKRLMLTACTPNNETPASTACQNQYSSWASTSSSAENELYNQESESFNTDNDQVSCSRAISNTRLQDPSVYLPPDWNPSQQIPLFPENSTIAVFLTRSRLGNALIEAYRNKGDFTMAERTKLVALIIDGLLERFDSLRNCHLEKIAEDLLLVFPTEVKETYYIGPCPEQGKRISRGKLVDRYRNQSRWRKKKVTGETSLNKPSAAPRLQPL